MTMDANTPIKQISVIGLGYVGLPLAAALGRTYAVLGFDINAQRIAELRKGHDSTRETTHAQLQAARHLRRQRLSSRCKSVPPSAGKH